MKVFLLNDAAVMEDCWNAYFSNEPDVCVICDTLKHFLSNIRVDCVVLPANSYGLMDGGLDLAISERCIHYQLFPNLNHCICIKFAVFQQVVSGSLLFFWRHVLDLREDRHCFSSVMDTLKIMVVQTRIIREDCRKYALDRE